PLEARKSIPRVTRQTRPEERLDFPSAYDGSEKLEQLNYAHRGAGGDVQRLSDHVGVHRQNVRLNHVLDVDEIARLLSVTEDDGGFSPQKLFDENVDHTAVIALKLPRPIDVEVSQEYGLEPVRSVIGMEITLYGNLRSCIG